MKTTSPPEEKPKPLTKRQRIAYLLAAEAGANYVDALLRLNAAYLLMAAKDEIDLDVDGSIAGEENASALSEKMFEAAQQNIYKEFE